MCWFYNERHQGEVPMDDLGGTIKNVSFQKVKSGQIVAQVHKEFSDATMKFVASIITVHLGRLDKIVDPERIHQAPSIPRTLSIHKSVRQINDWGDYNIKFYDWGDYNIKFFKTVVDQEAFHTQCTTKLEMLFVVRGSPIKLITSTQRAGIGIQKTGVNGYNVPFVKNGFTKHVFTFKSNF